MCDMWCFFSPPWCPPLHSCNQFPGDSFVRSTSHQWWMPHGSCHVQLSLDLRPSRPVRMSNCVNSSSGYRDTFNFPFSPKTSCPGDSSEIQHGRNFTLFIYSIFSSISIPQLCALPCRWETSSFSWPRFSGKDWICWIRFTCTVSPWQQLANAEEWPVHQSCW